LVLLFVREIIDFLDFQEVVAKKKKDFFPSE